MQADRLHARTGVCSAAWAMRSAFCRMQAGGRRGRSRRAVDSRKIWRARHTSAQRPLCARTRVCVHVACCLGRGRAHNAWHARVCALKALCDCGVPRTDVCPHSHGRQKGQCNKPCQHRHVRPSRRRVEVRRRTASQRHVPWAWAHGPWPMADRPGKAWKGPGCRQKGLWQATYDEHTQTCTCVCCFVLLCYVSLCLLHVCVFAFVCSFVRAFVCVCVFALSCVCLFLARECACSLVHLSWAEQ